MFTLVTIAAAVVTGLLVLATRWAARSPADRALRDITVSRDWLMRHRAQDRP